MKRFEEGRSYRAYDGLCGYVTVEKRTDAMVHVETMDGDKLRMKVHTDENGNEYAFKPRVPEEDRFMRSYRAELDI